MGSATCVLSTRLTLDSRHAGSDAVDQSSRGVAPWFWGISDGYDDVGGLLGRIGIDSSRVVIILRRFNYLYRYYLRPGIRLHKNMLKIPFHILNGFSHSHLIIKKQHKGKKHILSNNYKRTQHPNWTISRHRAGTWRWAMAFKFNRRLIMSPADSRLICRSPRSIPENENKLQ